MVAMAETSAEVHFAQRLAANDKPTRDRAIKKLRKWLNKKGSFTEVELLKIWKGLHYCMWMQDKPLLQEELAENISQLVHVFSQIETKFIFIQTFFQTEAREWSSIDRWRIDKFMMLVRRVLRQSLLFIKKRRWKNSDIKKLTQILTEHLIKSISDGLKIHFADIYMEELEQAGAESLSSDHVTKFLEPFMVFLPTEKNIAVAKRYITRVFLESIIQQSIDDAMATAEKQIQKEEQDGSDAEENDDPDDSDDLDDTPRLQFDFEKIADRLFKLGGNKDCIARNRALMYDVVKKLRDLNEGILPVDEAVSDASDGEIDNKEIAKAVKRLTALENVDRGGKKNRKKKNKKKKENKEDIKISNETKMETENDTEKENCKKESGDIAENKTQSHSKTDTKKNKTKRKYNTEELVEVIENEKTPKKKRKLSETSNDAQKSSSKKLKKEMESFLKLKDDSETVSDETNKTPKQKKKQKTFTSATTKVLSGFNEISQVDSSGQNAEKSSGKKSKYEKVMDFENSELSELNISVKDKSRKTAKFDSDNIELTVSGVETKKSKGRNTESGFAKFEKLKKTPPAFVRKAVKKLSTPKTEPRKKKPKGLQISEPPGSAPLGKEKRKSVSFDMKSNTTLDFNKDVHLSPATPFNPGQKPETSILKAGLSPSPITPKVKRQLKKIKKSSTPKKRAKATDFFYGSSSCQ